MAAVTKTVLSSKLTGGPLGIGDPEDRSLRKVEIEVLIPQKMRDIAKIEKCPTEVAAFNNCGKTHGLALVFKCRSENDALKQCLQYWYENPAFRERCTNEYLKERSEFRRTGISSKKANAFRGIPVELQ